MTLTPAEATTSDPQPASIAVIAERVEDLISRMTLEEKAGQLTQLFYLGIQEIPDDFDLDALPPEHRALVERPQIVEKAIADGTTGSLLFITGAEETNRLQRIAVEQSRLGIPLLFGFDVVHGLHTILPVPIALAATWAPPVIEAGQAAAAREARAAGVHWTFAPMIDVTRDARWGRIVESAGEDPVLASAVAAAQVRGFQGDGGPATVLAGPKHLAGYGAGRGGRDYDDVEVSDSELWNVYLPPFRAAVDAGAANVMSAYMDLNGVPASANGWLLTDVLRNELGFTGWVVSDANAVRSLETQHFAADQQDAASRAMNAGLDMEITIADPAFSSLPAAVRDGLVKESRIDEAVRRIHSAKFRLGLFDEPYVSEHAQPDADAGLRVAQTAAEQSLVLLKNAGLLPLSPAGVRTVAVIGGLADSARDTVGPWVFKPDLDHTVTILDGVTERLRGHADVVYAPGVGVPARLFPSMFDGNDLPPPSASADVDEDAEFRHAVEVAGSADVAVVVVGQRQNQIGENASTATLNLPGRQLEQLQAIAATGTPVVVLVMSGRPLDLRWIDANVPAIMQVWYPGSGGGAAVAAALFGDVSPGGRLPFTWPRRVGQVPITYAHNRTHAPQDQDKRYFEEHSTPLYPFGYGLSYATFSYTNLRLGAPSVAVGDAVSVSVDVRNDGAVPADEVVQLYTHQRYGSASRPVRELKGFHRVTLTPGERRTVSFQLTGHDLRYWSAHTRSYVQDATTIDIRVAGDSTATLSTELTVHGRPTPR